MKEDTSNNNQGWKNNDRNMEWMTRRKINTKMLNMDI